MKPKFFLLPHWVLRNNVSHKHTMSTLFRPVVVAPSNTKSGGEAQSKSQKLMISNGLIRLASSGNSFHLLPLAIKSLEKLVKIIDNVLAEYSCQKIQMPTLTSSHLWEATGRLGECGSEILQLKDRHSKQLILSPTHEEAICDMLREYPWLHKNLPIRLYQITTKFRDELRPRFGLLRSREFLMKDLYTFDLNETHSLKTYQEINEAYSKIFENVGINYLKVEGTSGIMGGNLSHEYHLPSDVGEDKLISCISCGSAFNEQVIQGHAEIKGEEKEKTHSCVKCNSTNTKSHVGIEIGHAFHLGKKYSQTFKIQYKDTSSKSAIMDMGCYGIGVTRFLAGVLEVLSINDNMKWPVSIAPFIVAVIPPKAGSKEELHNGMELTKTLCSYLNEILPNDTLVDDRLDMTIGKRFMDIQKLGIPYVMILGKGILEPDPLIEVHNLNEGTSNKMTFPEIQNYMTTFKNKS